MSANRTPIDFLSDYDIGDGLKAADVNAFIGAAKRLQKIFGMEGSGDSDCYAIAGSHTNFRRDLIPVLNSTGGDIPLGGIAKPDLPIYPGGTIPAPGFTGFPYVMNVVKVDTTYNWKYLVSTESVIPDGGTGWMTYLWNTGGPVLLSTSSVSNPTIIEWGPKDDEYYLVPQRPGFFLESTLTIEGVQTYAIMSQRKGARVFGHTTEVIGQDSIGTVELHSEGALAGGPGLNLFLDCINHGKSIPNDDPVYVDPINGDSYVVGAKEDLIP